MAQAIPSTLRVLASDEKGGGSSPSLLQGLGATGMLSRLKILSRVPLNFWRPRAFLNPKPKGLIRRFSRTLESSRKGFEITWHRQETSDSEGNEANNLPESGEG